MCGGVGKGKEVGGLSWRLELSWQLCALLVEHELSSFAGARLGGCSGIKVQNANQRPQGVGVWPSRFAPVAGLATRWIHSRVS